MRGVGGDRHGAVLEEERRGPERCLAGIDVDHRLVGDEDLASLDPEHVPRERHQPLDRVVRSPVRSQPSLAARGADIADEGPPPRLPVVGDGVGAHRDVAGLRDHSGVGGLHLGRLRGSASGRSPERNEKRCESGCAPHVPVAQERSNAMVRTPGDCESS